MLNRVDIIYEYKSNTGCNPIASCCPVYCKRKGRHIMGGLFDF